MEISHILYLCLINRRVFDSRGILGAVQSWGYRDHVSRWDLRLSWRLLDDSLGLGRDCVLDVVGALVSVITAGTAKGVAEAVLPRDFVLFA